MERPLLLLFVQATIFLNMFAIGLNQSWDDLTSLWRDPGQLIRSLLAAIVLVPAVVIVILWAFDLAVPVATGLAILAAAAGAPMTYKRSQMAAASTRYVASLQLSLAVLAVIVTPLTLAVFYSLFELATEGVSAVEVAGQIAKVQLLPVVLALLAGRFLPQAVSVATKPLTKLADVMFLLLVLIALVPGIRMVLSLVGGGGIAACLILAIMAILIGHLLGGPSPGERSGLAVASVARNIGLALFIAALGDAHQQIVPALVTFMFVGAIVAIPYSLRMRKLAAVGGS
jgi:BASS family bile acid:Na+ symporter